MAVERYRGREYAEIWHAWRIVPVDPVFAPTGAVWCERLARRKYRSSSKIRAAVETAWQHHWKRLIMLARRLLAAGETHCATLLGKFQGLFHALWAAQRDPEEMSAKSTGFSSPTMQALFRAEVAFHQMKTVERDLMKQKLMQYISEQDADPATVFYGDEAGLIPLLTAFRDWEDATRAFIEIAPRSIQLEFARFQGESIGEQMRDTYIRATGKPPEHDASTEMDA